MSVLALKSKRKGEGKEQIILLKIVMERARKKRLILQNETSLSILLLTLEASTWFM